MPQNIYISQSKTENTNKTFNNPLVYRILRSSYSNTTLACTSFKSPDSSQIQRSRLGEQYVKFCDTAWYQNILELLHLQLDKTGKKLFLFMKKKTIDGKDWKKNCIKKCLNISISLTSSLWCLHRIHGLCSEFLSLKYSPSLGLMLIYCRAYAATIYKTGIGLTTGFIGSHTVTHNYSVYVLQLITVHYNTCWVFTLCLHWLAVFQYRRIRSPASLQLFSEDCCSARILTD
jgi:hypothetical protein